MSYGILEQAVLSESTAGDPRHETEIRESKRAAIIHDLTNLANVLESNKSYIGDLPADKVRVIMEKVRNL